MPQDTITVRILEGRNLIAADRGGTSDPYAVVRVDTTKHKTKIIKKCLNPKWMETFKFTVQNTKTSKVVVEIWDKDFLKKDDPLGCVTIPLTNLEKGVEKLEWYNLNGVPKGQVYVGVTADTFDTAVGGNSLAKNNNYPISGAGQPPQDPFNSNNSLYPPPIAQPFNSMPGQFYPGQMSYPPQMYPPDPYTSMPMGNPYGQYPPQPNQYPPQLNYPPPQNYGSSLPPQPGQYPPQPNQYPPQLNYPPSQNYGSSLPPQPGQFPPGAQPQPSQFPPGAQPQPGQFPPGAQPQPGQFPPSQNYGSSLPPQPGQFPPGAQPQPGQFPPGAQQGQFPPGQPGQFPPGQQGY